MRRLSFIIIALLACIGNSFAEDKLQVEDFTINPGGTATLNLLLSNPDAEYTAIQADLYLPDGIDLVTENEDYKYSLSRVAESHSLSIGKKTGFYRLILSSSKSEVLSGTSGKVISLTVKADANLSEGAKNGSLKDIKLAKVDGTGLVIEQAAYSVTVTQLKVTAPEGKTNLVYSGNAQDLVTAGSSSDGEMQYSLDDTNYGTAIPQGTDAKEYTVYYKVVDNLGQNLVDPASFKVTIAAKIVSSPTITLSETSYTYDGNAKEPTVTVKDGETTISSSEYTVSYSNNTNVGSATVTITDKDGGNYIVSGSTTFTISAADGNLTPPTAKSGLVYTGSAQDLITAGSSTTGTIQYSLNGTNYSTSIPQGTDAKEYTVYYKVVANAGYNDVDPASFKVTIAAKKVSSPTITLSETSYVYDGQAKEPTVTVKDEGTTISASEYSVSYSNNTNVGTATVTITDKDGGNYNVSGSVTFTISAADGSLTPPTAKSGLVYSGSAQDLITAGSSTTGTIQYSLDGTNYSTSIPQGTDAKEYTVYYKVVANAGYNDVAPASFKVTIAAKTVSSPTITLSETSYTYDGNAKEPTVTVKDGETTIPSSEYTVSYANNTNVGTATVTITDKEGGNFNVSGSATFSITGTEPVSETTPITIGNSGKASYCGDKSLDFSFSEEVKAYIATGFDKDEGTIWLTRVKDVPAGVPVLIKGEANKTYDVPVTDSENSYYTNMFVGNTSGASIEIYETSDDGSKVNYYLKDGTFRSVSGNAKIGNNKCYLQLPATFNASVTGASQSVTVGQTGKASFAAPVDLDFTNVEGLKAFTATGYDKSTKTIWLTRVLKVQQGEGVLLKGDPDDYEIPSFAVQSHYENMFVGNTSGATIEIPETSDDGSQTNFYLKSGTFLSVTGNAKIGNNKCYLALPTSMVAAGASTRSAEENYKFEEPEMIKLPINFRSLENDGDGTTGIKVQSSMFNAPSDAYYTLQGQRVVNPSKGLYIKNGKKILIK